MRQTKITLAAIAITAALLTAIAPLLITSASAKITQETVDTSCSNNGGHDPGGQQPSCSGSGLTQNTETTCNHNPSGTEKCPGGHNK
jgi:hypothetical protein